ncbi:hypothetical protein ACLMJV_22780 [Sinorhizobium meliloti]|uniref:hypothetical protein n=1 Tax=Rhizobium meliloti TaxID=382 RepID=UPI00398CF253
MARTSHVAEPILHECRDSGASPLSVPPARLSILADMPPTNPSHGLQISSDPMASDGRHYLLESIWQRDTHAGVPSINYDGVLPAKPQFE